MLYLAHSFLNESEQKDLKKGLLMSSGWADGVNTATGSTKNLKRNLQLTRGEIYDKYSDYIINSIKKNSLIENYAFPADIFQI